MLVDWMHHPRAAFLQNITLQFHHVIKLGGAEWGHRFAKEAKVRHFPILALDLLKSTVTVVLADSLEVVMLKVVQVHGQLRRHGLDAVVVVVNQGRRAGNLTI